MEKLFFLVLIYQAQFLRQEEELFLTEDESLFSNSISSAVELSKREREDVISIGARKRSIIKYNSTQPSS